ncbi:glutathione S-transferase family protein [Polymorphobacter arshaanensis]|uniref:Glutathione S-transferase family protein n=1 Tax=Glacieibacterium arshaanense TaxID=2511025 RepID=A0A4Y9EL98_9SPHN|nr:glutathione S-transferase family protein [Polymorphobacter arshaanensis]
MQLIGQYDSPFVRRVGIALRLYELPFDHKPWSVFGDFEKIRPYNPLLRVPTLVLGDGTALIDSASILDYLDGQVPPGRALFPRQEPARHRALRVATLATGMAEKAVSLFYELRFHEQRSDLWVSRCRAQIDAVLQVLEDERVMHTGAWWFGPGLGHADIAVCVVLRFIADAHPGLIDMTAYPALTDLAARFEALPVAREISQAFTPSA